MTRWSLLLAIVALASCNGSRVPRPPENQPGQSPLDVARDFLLSDAKETPGFGLYSYILFGSIPESKTSETYRRYAKTVAAYLDLETVASAKGLNNGNLGQINVTYLPLVGRPIRMTPDAVIEAYDYSRAAHILRLARRVSGGPYILSAQTPLSNQTELPAHRLFQDLTTVPPDLIQLWMDNFRQQSAQPQFWLNGKDRYLLALRSDVGRGGETLARFNDAIASLIWSFPVKH